MLDMRLADSVEELTALRIPHHFRIRNMGKDIVPLIHLIRKRENDEREAMKKCVIFISFLNNLTFQVAIEGNMKIMK